MTERSINHENAAKEVITQALISGLKSTYELHEMLGNAGTSAVGQNQLGETTLVFDMESEEKILAELRKTNIPMSIFSEEHGEFTTGVNPIYTVSLDGLDGSGEYKNKRGVSMYGAMTCVLEGDDPSYDNYVAAGVMIHSPTPTPTPTLLVAIKNQGIFQVDLKTGERMQIRRDNDKQFSEQTIINLDINWPPYKKLLDENNQTFPHMQCAFFSEAAVLALFAQGKIDVDLEWTRKGNLEQPVMYAFVHELGGVMTRGDGISLGSEQFRTFKQNTHVPLIVAPNQDMATAVSKRFNLDALQSNNYTRIG